MAETAYATGPALLGAPRLLSSIFSRIFCSLFHRGAQMVRHYIKFPRKREAPKFKKRGPKERGPKRFFRSLFQRGGPNSPSATENARPKNLKREGPKGILFPAVSVSARGPKERGIQTAWAPIGPNAKPNIKKMRGPKV